VGAGAAGGRIGIAMPMRVARIKSRNTGRVTWEWTPPWQVLDTHALPEIAPHVACCQAYAVHDGFRDPFPASLALHQGLLPAFI